MRKDLNKDLNEMEKPCIEEKNKCGIVMPISDTPGYPSGHWADVRQILSDSITAVGLIPCLVSEANETQIIHKTIVQNLFFNEILVCDVSSKNSNVMFELGMRLAFDKPVVIVKDDATAYSFDTSPIEHITYPKELRHPNIEEFKKELSKKIRETLEAAKQPSYSTFLKHFAVVNIAKLPTFEGSSSQLLIEKIDDLTSQVAYIKHHTVYPYIARRTTPSSDEERNMAVELIKDAVDIYCAKRNIEKFQILNNPEEKEELIRYIEDKREIRSLCKQRRILHNLLDQELHPF